MTSHNEKTSAISLREIQSILAVEWNRLQVQSSGDDDTINVSWNNSLAYTHHCVCSIDETCQQANASEFLDMFNGGTDWGC